MARGPKTDPSAEIRGDLRSGELKPIYLLFGDQAFLARKAFDALFAAAVKGGPRGFNEQIFLGESCSGDDVVSAASTLPMMGPRRTIVVRNVDKLKKEPQERLAGYCANPSPTSVVIFVSSDGARKALDGRGKLAKAIKKTGRWCEFKKLYGRNLHGWIETEAKRQKKRLERGATQYLEDIAGTDLAQIHNGLQLAALFVGDAPEISVADLAAVMTGRKQEALWDLLDDLGQRRGESALRNLQRCWSQGEEPIGILNLVRRRVVQLHTAEAGVAQGLRRDEALRAAGVSPNMAWKWDKQLGRYRVPELSRARRRMLQAESDVKGGLRIDRRWAVERAIMDVIRGA
jgi:DNA polymerase III subunit delta